MENFPTSLGILLVVDLEAHPDPGIPHCKIGWDAGVPPKKFAAALIGELAVVALANREPSGVGLLMDPKLAGLLCAKSANVGAAPKLVCPKTAGVVDAPNFLP